MASANNSNSVRCIERRNEEIYLVRQLTLFGAQEMPQDKLIRAYMDLGEEKRRIALKFILERDDKHDILTQVIQELFYHTALTVRLRNKKSLVLRREEIQAIIHEMEDAQLSTVLYFCVQSVGNLQKTKRSQKKK